jgi:hypothetical protein
MKDGHPHNLELELWTDEARLVVSRSNSGELHFAIHEHDGPTARFVMPEGASAQFVNRLGGL